MSYTNTITPKYAYNIYTPGVKSFANGANNVVLFDKRHNQNAPVSKTDLQIKQLKEEFKLAKDEQGVIGKAWNGIKNLFKTEYSSSNIEKSLNSLNSNSTDEEINNVKNMIAKYRSKQDLAVDTVATTGATIAACAAGAKVGAMIGGSIGSIFPGIGTLVGGALGTVLGFVGGAIVGAVAKVGVCQLENMTDNVDKNSWHNDKNIGKQVTSGALSGATAILFGGISKKVSGLCKGALGLSEQGVVVAANGSANVAKTAAATALAEGAGGAAASTVIADGEYLIRCAADDNTEFSWGDLAQTTGISAVTGGVMSAGFGAITGYKNAKSFNKEWLLDQMAKTPCDRTDYLTRDIEYKNFDDFSSEITSGKNNRYYISSTTEEGQKIRRIMMLTKNEADIQASREYAQKILNEKLSQGNNPQLIKFYEENKLDITNIDDFFKGREIIAKIVPATKKEAGRIRTIKGAIEKIISNNGSLNQTPFQSYERLISGNLENLNDHASRMIRCTDGSFAIYTKTDAGLVTKHLYTADYIAKLKQLQFRFSKLIPSLDFNGAHTIDRLCYTRSGKLIPINEIEKNLEYLTKALKAPKDFGVHFLLKFSQGRTNRGSVAVLLENNSEFLYILDITRRKLVTIVPNVQKMSILEFENVFEIPYH